MNLPKPETICEKCLKTEYKKGDKDIRIYCPHNRVGASMQIVAGHTTGVWFLVSPATPEVANFIANVSAAAVKA